MNEHRKNPEICTQHFLCVRLARPFTGLTESRCKFILLTNKSCIVMVFLYRAFFVYKTITLSALDAHARNHQLHGLQGGRKFVLHLLEALGSAPENELIHLSDKNLPTLF